MGIARGSGIFTLTALAVFAVIPETLGIDLAGAAPAKDDVRLYANPNVQNCSHRVGNLWMTITNWGFFGSQFNHDQLDERYCQRPVISYGSLAPSAEFPAGSGINYLYQGALWVGAIVGEDTLVSVGADGWQHANEMYPAGVPFGGIVRESSRPVDQNYSPFALSEEDMYAEYFDTLVDNSWTPQDVMDGRPHQPLDLQIRQESYSWSQLDREKFIIFRCHVKNIGSHILAKMFIGLLFDADVWHAATPNGFDDDISGSYELPDPSSGGQMLVAWSADNDGDPDRNGVWDIHSARAVIGASLLAFPTLPQQSFNWWVSNGDPMLDWGPRLAKNDRNFGTGGIGTPEGDRNKYYVMSTAEDDYDQLYSRMNHTSDGWLPPFYGIATEVADGYDTRFLLSFGSVDLAPGDSTEFAFVVAIGDNFHRNPNDFKNLFDANNPQAFHDSLDFSDLTANILTARELYRQLFVVVPGDADRSGIVDIVDAIFLVNYIFRAGPEPSPSRVGDVNQDCRINIADVVYLVLYLFSGGEAPALGC